MKSVIRRFVVIPTGLFLFVAGFVLSYRQTVMDGYQVGGMTIVWSALGTLGILMAWFAKSE